MIVICDPVNKRISHEKVNSGFIYGLSLAFPKETIRFYADITHIEAIKDILIHDNVLINNIEYIPIKFLDPGSILSILTYYSLIKKIFSEMLEIGTNKIFFLSFNPMILYVIKKIKQQHYFSNFKFTFVLHGSFENIADGNDKPAGLSMPFKKINNKYIIQIIRRTRFIDFPKKAIGIISKTACMPLQSISKKLFHEKEMLLWKHSNDFKYICLSPHIIINAEKYVNTKYLNMYTVVLPTVFAEPLPQPDNKHVKFATFGYGNSLILQNVLYLLSKKDLKKTYEIRIIGMDNRGTEGFPNINCPSPGKVLVRSDMEKFARDIDIFLILYDFSRYRLSCSGSIMESLSYTKPILHFNNDCINTFNKPERPIGICCNSLEEFVNKMEDIIENYNIYLHKFQTFRKNILKLRDEYAIKNSLPQLKDSFTWEDL